ncbi:DUF2236 domain-containing protein [Gelidibacter salicanalis]|uniref:DUF2236 domain-containing protein n=1 Tax=Gelidibacter salicanalis TaxID=291193 RepID=A0A5C7ARQ6_9FLAO|nr:oxygenase MpaB family protein [Gelidibacter salicanalis]TXE10339.1 DUF2236 domain-containing protein [Gelidibacter salicanalis]
MIENKNNITFWSDGNGHDFLEWANLHESELVSNYNVNLFEEYDSEVDKLTEQWMRKGDFKTIMKSLHSNSDEKGMPEDYIEFKKNLQVVPEWLDLDLILEGCQLSERSGLTRLLVLRNFALLGGYNFANLTKPLVATGSLEKGAAYRLYNTLNFWVDVSRSHAKSGELRLNGCLRTRLVHSASRLMIQNKHPDWNVGTYGVPINHADMVATNIAFTVYYLFGLQKLNFKFSEKEESGIFHLWKYVTYLLGVPAETIPNDKAEALNFFHFWTRYQAQPDQDALKLTASLLHENTPISIFKLDIIKRNMEYIHTSISNHLIDSTIRKNLEIPEVRFKNIIPKALQLKNQLTKNNESQIKDGREKQRSVLNDYKNRIT